MSAQTIDEVYMSDYVKQLAEFDKRNKKIMKYKGKLSAPKTAAIFGVSASRVKYIWKRGY